MVVSSGDLAVPKSVSSIRNFKATFLLSPKQWSRYSGRAPLVWASCLVTSHNISSIPNDKHGIYSFVVVPSVAQHACAYLMYIGMARDQSLQARIKQYIAEARSRDGRELIKDLFRRWRNHLHVYYATVADATLIEEIEDRLILAYLPPCNDKLPAKCGSLVKAAWR